ncbi:MAG: hypothetical protein GY719_31580 [bacterium]|nr:hypothetical protein [bacterium]
MRWPWVKRSRLDSERAALEQTRTELTKLLEDNKAVFRMCDMMYLLVGAIDGKRLADDTTGIDIELQLPREDYWSIRVLTENNCRFGAFPTGDPKPYAKRRARARFLPGAHGRRSTLRLYGTPVLWSDDMEPATILLRLKPGRGD